MFLFAVAARVQCYKRSEKLELLYYEISTSRTREIVCQKFVTQSVPPLVSQAQFGTIQFL